ncbi:hypothetical protein [Yoonia sp. SS1-5]|uniref:YscD-like Bon-like domain-containing protein n=1 Tax=Yoonia rhodophyticola TaxID=3137370 RepID=A0AAN0NM78_9RHOB
MDVIAANKEVFADRFKEMQSKVRPENGAVALSFDFMSGIQEGTGSAIRTQEIWIGSASECEVLLVDEGVLENHVCLEVTRTLLGAAISLKEVVGPTEVIGQKNVPGKPYLLPVDLDVAGTRIRISRYNSALPALIGNDGVSVGTDAPPTGPQLWIGLGLCATLLLGLGLFFSMETMSSDTQLRRLTVLTNPPVEADPVQTDTDAIGFLEQRLADAGLSEVVSATIATDEVIAISGSVPESNWSRWQRIHQDFDAEFPQLLQVSIAKQPKPHNFPPIAAIRLTPPTQITMEDGNKVTTGDVVLGGWVIADVSVAGITIEKDGETAVISY